MILRYRKIVADYKEKIKETHAVGFLYFSDLSQIVQLFHLHKCMQRCSPVIY